MNRILILLLMLSLTACNGQNKKQTENTPQASQTAAVKTPPKGKVEKTDEEWRQALTKEQYEVLRLKGNRNAFYR
jgi:hypothetical protein